jgi:DNA-binding transcriptional MocR family regulator
LKKAAQSYWFDFLLCIEDPCDPLTNPDGYIALCLAENKLVQETLALRLIENPGTTINAFSDSAVYSYNGFLGLVQSRDAVAYFLERWMLKSLENENRSRIISSDNIVLASGVGSLVSNLLYLISDVGDVLLIPAPYYTGYEHQAKAIAGCTPWPVYMKNPVLGPDTDDLEMAAKAVEKVGLHSFTA